MKVEVYILYLLVHLKGTPENRSKSLLIGLDESFKLTRTIWFSEKTPGTLHQINKTIPIRIIIVNFENLQMHKYIPEREHFSVYQMMIHSAIWSEQGFMFSLYQYTDSKKKKKSEFFLLKKKKEIDFITTCYFFPFITFEDQSLDEFVASSKCTSKERFSNPLKTLKYKNEQIRSKIILYTEIPNMGVTIKRPIYLQILFVQ
ncbi:hypothetical protein ACJX0J_002552 [Zea mays]